MRSCMWPQQQPTCVFLHSEPHVANEAVRFTKQERNGGTPQNRAKPQTGAINFQKMGKKG